MSLTKLTSSSRRPALVVGIVASALVFSACNATWGLRSSYRSYIAGGIAQGAITTSQGATWLDGPGTGKGPFRWPVHHATFNAGAVTGTVQMNGSVKTVGHPTPEGHVLDLTVTNPRLVINGDNGTLYADLNFRPFVEVGPTVGPLRAATDVAFGAVDLSDVAWTPASDGTYEIVDAPMTGIPAAMQLIGWDNFYGSDVRLDPLSVKFLPSSGPPPVAATPSITVSRTTGLRFGDAITVWGTGFDPQANIGTRPPLAGKPAGVYVVFGKFANTWRPSQGAPSSARTVIAQRWALPTASRALLDGWGIDPGFVTIGNDGRFKATLTLGSSTASGNYGVYTFAGSGAVNSAHEFATLTSVS